MYILTWNHDPGRSILLVYFLLQGDIGKWPWQLGVWPPRRSWQPASGGSTARTRREETEQGMAKHWLRKLQLEERPV